MTKNLSDEKVLLVPIKKKSKSSTMPAEISENKGISVAWKNLNVTALIKKESLFRSTTYTEKEIIRNASGYIRPNSLVAIMGASGSGKSTLMSVLANRQTGDLKISGDIRINGKKIQMKYLRRISGYVYQEDSFMPSLTVLEHMHFAAKLKLDRRMTQSQRTHIINELLTDVGLLNCSRSCIGSMKLGTGKMNLSGGEQKRLSVATELLTDPPLLFCDEPTTGLDSYSAFKLTCIMKELAEQRNRTIICSIHQPNKQLFSLFHEVILLYKGQIAFIGTPNNASEFFGSLGHNCLPEQNSAEFLVKSLAIIPGKETESAERAADICKQFKVSQYADEIYRNIANEATNQQTYNVPVETEIQKRLWPFHLILYRDILSILRDPNLQGVTILNKIGLGLLIGVCMMGSVTMTQEGIQSLKGVLFTMIAENFFASIYSSHGRLAMRMPLFRREYSNNMNSPSMFYIANLLSYIPGMMIDASAFCTIVYWLTGLKATLATFGLTVFVIILVIITSSALGTLISTFTPDIGNAQLLLLPITQGSLMLAGIFINYRTVPFYFQWVRYVSWVALANEVLMILQMDGVDNIACPSSPDLPCLKTGAEVLETLDYSPDHLWRNITLMIIMYLVLNLLAFSRFSWNIFFTTKRKILGSEDT